MVSCDLREFSGYLLTNQLSAFKENCALSCAHENIHEYYTSYRNKILNITYFQHWRKFKNGRLNYLWNKYRQWNCKYTCLDIYKYNIVNNNIFHNL